MHPRNKIAIATCFSFSPSLDGEYIGVAVDLVIPPAYKVYRGYIVFVFSVIVCVCLCVCVCVNFFFSSKISQELLHLGF